MPSPRRRASLPRAVMAVSWATLTLSTSAEDSTGCTITAKICSNFPDFQRTQFRDDIGETHVNAGGNDAACLKRAEDFHHWCGNGASDAQVAASYEREQLSQVYHPGACPGGWSQWDAFCYKHFWEKKTWFEAEAFCRQYGEGSHLASIHSRAENRFIFALTGGLSAWIGYTDLDQDTHYKWSDNTQDDFSNFAKNCTGREHEPDCKPEERQQQWYDWEGHDRGTFVCKRNALLPVALLRNVSARILITRPWHELLPTLASSLESNTTKSQVSLKVDAIAKPEASAAEGKPMLEPRLGFFKVRPHRTAAVGLCALAAALAARRGDHAGEKADALGKVTELKKRFALRVECAHKTCSKVKMLQVDVHFEIGWQKNKDRNLDFMEKVVRQQLHGRMQMQFSSEHFFDAMPLMSGMSTSRRAMGNGEGHDYDDIFYVRKYLEPAKFKKLALGNWEMPENATRVVTLPELVDAGVQYGHKSNMWNPKMLKYLYADNGGTHIFDLVQTAANLNRACYYCMEAAAKGANFIFIGTKEQAREQVKKYAEEAGVPYCDLRFVGGVISNFAVIRKSVDMMLKLKEEKQQNAWSVLSEFKRFLNECKLNRMEKKYAGIVNLTSYPDICIFVDEAKERLPLAEMTRIGVPTVGMVDSNNDPTYVDIPIPSNTSSTRSIELVLRKLSEAIKKGKALAQMNPQGPPPEDKEWDPWILSRDRIRFMRRRSKRQGWMKGIYGSYENWKKCHPWGAVPTVAPFHDFKWNDILDPAHN
ncbi:unnamed protein product [Durusdinium trenchii]|uniref:C-type lectin domain-containing protein n=1 Tax=Durusdinium trenchii TaxID=1381693 RepID=A0ABP0HQJ8_9DINO